MDGTSAPGAAAAVDVLFVLLPNSLILDWAGPAEAFRLANQIRVHRGQPPAFLLRYAGPLAETATSVGATVSGLEPLPLAFGRRSWIVVAGVSGNKFDAGSAPARAAVQWLGALPPAPDGSQLVTICAGALLAAHAGLLRGRSATTHHHHLDELHAVEPACQVVANRVFVHDERPTRPGRGFPGDVWSSAGVTTGIDLALHLIARECGAPLAAQVAQSMVVALRRGPNDPELSPFLAYRNHIHPALHKVQDAVSLQPQQGWTVSRMADAGHTSARHLTRLFIDHAGIAPLQYLRRIRLAAAQAALQSGRNVTQAAELAGFSSDTQLRRAWRQFEAGGTPSDAAVLQKP